MQRCAAAAAAIKEAAKQAQAGPGKADGCYEVVYAYIYRYFLFMYIHIHICLEIGIDIDTGINTFFRSRCRYR